LPQQPTNCSFYVIEYSIQVSYKIFWLMITNLSISLSKPRQQINVEINIKSTYYLTLMMFWNPHKSIEMGNIYIMSIIILTHRIPSCLLNCSQTKTSTKTILQLYLVILEVTKDVHCS
jgi:hypothetical protein